MGRSLASIEHCPNALRPDSVFKSSKATRQIRLFYRKWQAELLRDGFDIIIDDASHIGELTKATFWHLFDRHLKPGGLYAIEDWGTGYLDDFPDGKKIRAQAIDSRSASVIFTAAIEEKNENSFPAPFVRYGRFR